MRWSIENELRQFGPGVDHPPVSPEAADAYVRRLALGHYENFSVLSWFVPRELRGDFAAVYAFCRWADDLGDELGDGPEDRARGVELLGWWQAELEACFAGRTRHPVYVALARTVERHRLPIEPFADLVDAFVQDQRVTRYATWEQVVDYCRRSADPVGRIVLRLWGHHDAELDRLSDRTCTALQLVNFWQDVRRDIVERDRVYLPADLAAAHGLNLEAMAADVRAGRPTDPHEPAARAAIRDACERTAPLFAEGRTLLDRVEPRHRPTLELFSLGGEAVMHAIERQRYDTLRHRPALGKPAKLCLLGRALIGKLRIGRRARRQRPQVRPA
ncbi:MAG: squalene synthase HpnC [Planctomycetota bacterium]